MPGPSTTESRCAPTTTVLPAFFVLFGARSASTFHVGRVSDSVWVVIETVVPGADSSWPNGKLTLIAGIATGAPSVPAKRSVRSAPPLPWLKTIAPEAPASAAFVTLSPNGHVPRCSSAMLPGRSRRSRLSSQPDVMTLGSAKFTSTACTAPVAVPLPE